MKEYFDFHTKDVSIEWSEDWIEYCEDRNMEKQDEWLPFLSFPITKKCNFHCLYCGTGGEATASCQGDTSLEVIKENVDRGLLKGIKKIRITGGEPFLHSNIKEILNYLGSLGVYVLVNTNGSLITRNASWIKKLPTTVKFAVSFDTLRKERLKTISGYENHNDIVEGIYLLKSNGNLLRVNMVINKHNCDEVYDIIEFCKRVGCDLKILDVVSVPVPFSPERQDFYREVNSLEREFNEKCDEVYSHEYTRGFGTPCFRYKFGDTFVTVKNSKKGSHYDIKRTDSLCKKCNYYPCHEGLYDLFCLSDGRLCSCRWTEEQISRDPEKQIDWLIDAFKKSVYVYTGTNSDMGERDDLKQGELRRE